MFALCSVLASACCDGGDLVDNINDFAIKACSGGGADDGGSSTIKDGEDDTGEPTTGHADAGNEECCEEFGYLPNHGMICGASEMPWCVGCDGEPVLCMTHGCAVINAPDCCLSDEGETIACDPEK